jgi:WD40 repeat protein
MAVGPGRSIFQRCGLARLATLVLLGCGDLAAIDPHQPITQMHHTAWTAKDGLTGDLQSLAQTTDGFLWAGTSNGLLRFDGVSFERYTPEVGAYRFPLTAAGWRRCLCLYLMIVLDTEISLWDLPARLRLFTVRPPREPSDAITTSYAVSPDGGTLLTAQEDGMMRVWNAEGRQVAEIRVHPDCRRPGYHMDSGLKAAFAPGGKTFATADGPERTLTIWDRATLRPVNTLRGLTGSVRDLAFDRSGRWPESSTARQSYGTWAPAASASPLTR